MYETAFNNARAATVSDLDDARLAFSSAWQNPYQRRAAAPSDESREGEGVGATASERCGAGVAASPSSPSEFTSAASTWQHRYAMSAVSQAPWSAVSMTSIDDAAWSSHSIGLLLLRVLPDGVID